MSSAAFLLPSATACLPEGNSLAAFPCEDVFGNLDESREWIVSFILIASTTRAIWLHSYFHLHVIIVEHQPALSSDSNCPVADPPQRELLLVVFTWCFCQQWLHKYSQRFAVPPHAASAQSRDCLEEVTDMAWPAQCMASTAHVQYKGCMTCSTGHVHLSVYPTVCRNTQCSQHSAHAIMVHMNHGTCSAWCTDSTKHGHHGVCTAQCPTSRTCIGSQSGPSRAWLEVTWGAPEDLNSPVD